MLASIGVGLLYRTYLYFASENLYSKYGATVDDGDNRHKKIEITTVLNLLLISLLDSWFFPSFTITQNICKWRGGFTNEKDNSHCFYIVYCM